MRNMYELKNSLKKRKTLDKSERKSDTRYVRGIADVICIKLHGKGYHY